MLTFSYILAHKD